MFEHVKFGASHGSPPSHIHNTGNACGIKIGDIDAAVCDAVDPDGGEDSMGNKWLHKLPTIQAKKDEAIPTPTDAHLKIKPTAGQAKRKPVHKRKFVEVPASSSSSD